MFCSPLLHIAATSGKNRRLALKFAQHLAQKKNKKKRQRRHVCRSPDALPRYFLRCNIPLADSFGGLGRTAEKSSNQKLALQLGNHRISCLALVSLAALSGGSEGLESLHSLPLQVDTAVINPQRDRQRSQRSRAATRPPRRR